MATKTTYTKNADGTITSRFDETPDAPNPTTQAPIQPAQPQQTVSLNGTTYTRNADGTITSRFADTSTPQQPTQPAQPQQPAQPITDWKNLNDAQKTNENLAKLVENRYNTKAEMLPDGVSANVGDTRYSWYLDEGKNPIRTNGAKNTNANQQTDAQGRPLYGPNGERYVYGNDGTVRTILPDGSQKAPAGLTFDRNSSWNALDPKDKTINNLQKLIEARYGTLAEVEGDRVVADIGGKMYQWTLDQNGNPVKTEVPADNTQFNSGEILEQLKANPSLDLSSYDPVEASIAKSNYDKIQNFSDMTNQQLSESFNSGDLIPGTAVRNDLVKNNPNMKSFLEMCSILNLINGVTINPLMMEKKVEENATKNKGMIATALEDGEFSQKEIDEITMSDELKQQKKELDEQGKKVARLQSEYHTLELDIEDELKGQNATASYRDRLLAREGKNLYRELDLAQRTYQTMLGAYNDSYERSMTLFNLNLQLYKEAEQRSIEEQRLQEQRQWDIANQNRQMLMNYWNTLDERQYIEQQRQMQRQEAREDAIWNMETQMLYENGDLYSDNPALVERGLRNAFDSIYNSYASMVPGLESPDVTFQKALRRMQEEGLTPAECVQRRNDEVKNSQRVQDYIRNNQNQLNYSNWEMQQAMTPSYVTGTGMASNVISSFISQCRETGSCGQGVNDYLQKLGENRKFGDSYQSKYQYVNSDVPVEGAIAIRNPGNIKEGHVGIVTGIDGDYVTIHDWNLRLDNQQRDTKVPISSILADGKGGFYIPKVLQNNGGQQGKNYEPEHKSLYAKHFDGGMTDTERKDVIGMYGNYDNFVRSAEAWQNDQIDENMVELLQKATEFRDFIQGKDIGRLRRIASQKDAYKTLDADAAAFNRYYRNLVDSVALQNLIDLKGRGASFGSLSDNELSYITKASSKLDLYMNEKEFNKNLDAMIKAMEKKLGPNYQSTSTTNNATTTSTSGKTKTKSGGTINW